MQLLRKVLLFFSAIGFLGTVAAQGKILFNATKAETAGNADWIVDTDFNNITWNPNACLNCGSFANESSPQRFPTPAQSGISAATTETYWNGGISAWGVDCVKRGFTVESLPYYGSITYGNTSNPQDLSNYRVFVLPEPNILFTAAEKTAIFNFIKNGGGLFIVSGHSQNDRNNDGNDSPTILNDLLSNNGVGNGALGFTVDVQSFSQTSSNIPFQPSDSIVNGPYGNVSQVKWSSGTSVTLFPSQNPTVKGVVYKTGSNGNTGVLCAYARYQKGRVAVIGDSSPIDDGTGDVNDQLYPGYTGDVNGNHRRLIMNITVWLANSNSAISVPESTGPENECTKRPS
ncbi:MAG: hypothetical protein QM534_10195 [Sediminibacterium sp.]|nr:hypothetical protein [Sediminibacterium sp.]